MTMDLATPVGRFGGTARRRRAATYGDIVDGCCALTVFLGMIVLIEPSPYDLGAIVTMALWSLGGFRLHPFVLPFVALVFFYTLGGFVSLVPWIGDPDSTLFMEQSLYLSLTAVFFSLYFAEDAERRARLCLAAFTLGTVVAALCGIVGYFGVAGLGELFTRYGRAAGPFKDPNVYGSYLVLGLVGLIQTLMLGRGRHIVATLIGIAIVTGGIFLSFSRGSWGSAVVAVATSVGLAYGTARDPAVRRRIALTTCAALAFAILALGVLLAFQDTREFFFQRAALTQDYDEGATGRFGNQLRSLPMLLDLPNGFGPLRFRLTFGLEPHNSYINAFASYGWLGGCAFLLLVGLTFYVGFRLSLRPSPYRSLGQVFWPALMVSLLQGFQIDIDHWRHVYLMLGAVWGLETARMRDLEQRQAAGSAAIE